MNTGRWIVAQTDFYGEPIPGTHQDVTELVLDTAMALVGENTTAQECVAQDVIQSMTEQNRIQYTYWFA